MDTANLSVDELLAALREYFDQFPRPQTARRGQKYAVRARSFQISVLSLGDVEGVVKGHDRYVAQVLFLEYDDLADGTGGLCSCTTGRSCIHVYATALRLLAEIYQTTKHLVPWAAIYLPTAWRPNGAALPPAEFSGETPWIGAAGVERRPAAGEKPWWRSFLDAPRNDEAIQYLIRGLEGRFPRAPAIVRQLIARNVQGSSNSRMHLLQRFEDYTAAVSAREGWELRPDTSGLAEWLQSEDCQAILREEAKAACLKEMALWLAQRGKEDGGRSGHVDVVWDIVPPGGAAQFPTLSFQVLLSTKNLTRSVRHGKALDSLIHEVTGGTRGLPPAQAAIIKWIGRQSGFVSSRQTQHFPVRDAMLWLNTWQHRDVITWKESGEPVRFDHLPVKLTLAREEEQVFWAVRVAPDQKPLPLDQVTLVSDESQSSYHYARTAITVFVLHEGVLRPLETGDMPLSLLRYATTTPELPIADIKARGMGDQLMGHLRVFGSLEEDTLVEEVPVLPRVELYLAARNYLYVGAVAEDAHGRRFARIAQDQWPPATNKNPDEYDDEQGIDVELPAENTPEAPEAPEADAPPPAHEENPAAIAHRPRAADLAPVEAWLRTLIHPMATPESLPSGVPGYCWQLRGDALPAFLEAWDQRPARVRCYGNARLRDLVTLRTPPWFKLKIEESGVQWLQVSVETQAELDALSFAEIEEALRSQDSASILLPRQGRYRREDLEVYQAQVRTLADMGLGVNAGQQRVHALQLSAIAAEALPANGALQRLMEQGEALRRKFKGIPRARLPKALTTVLRPYQREGADFCIWACKTFGGAILADDMGLGKTLQVLAAMTALRGKMKNAPPALVVCPASVTHNWQREAARFTPNLRTLVLERGAQRSALLKQAGAYDLVIKNFALARRDIEALKDQPWSLICVDEAQAIKNPDAVITKALKALDAQYRIALTGTPIENRLTDLWSIVDFAVPGYLGRREDYESSVGKQPDELDYQRLRARLRPILLRRLKTEVAPELPPRIEERLDCTMTPAQRRAYLTELKLAQQLLQETKTQKRAAGQARIQILAALTRLRQLCCDPALRGLPKAGSGKVDVFLDCLQGLIDGGHKVLVFSQFVRMLDIITVKLEKRGIPHYTLTGQTKDRGNLVARFEADPNPAAFLISLKAGGTGLNLVSASYVILFDPWWNPAAEAQAIDRTHRIGQDKTVVAYRLVTEDSIEERIVELQEKKRALVANVLEADAFNRSLTRDDFDFILQ